MRARLATALLVAVALGGCEATGDPGGNKTFSDENVPFTFQIPVDFTKAPVDQGNTHGDVVAAAGLTKLDVIAVRRVPGGTDQRGAFRHQVGGHDVISELHPIPIQAGYVLECQYTVSRGRTVREACRMALDTVTPK